MAQPEPTSHTGKVGPGELVRLTGSGQPVPGAQLRLEAALINLGPPPMEADLSGEALEWGSPPRHH